MARKAKDESGGPGQNKDAEGPAAQRADQQTPPVEATAQAESTPAAEMGAGQPRTAAEDAGEAAVASREPAQASEATADPASKPAAGPSSAASAAGAPNDGGGTAGETASSSQQALRDGSAYAQLAVKQFADIATAQMTAFRQTSGAVANGGADIQAVYLSLAQANARAFADYAAALGEVRDPATLLHLQSSLVKSLMEETMGAGMRLSEIGRDLILTGWKVGQEQRAAITETSAGRAR